MEGECGYIANALSLSEPMIHQTVWPDPSGRKLEISLGLTVLFASLT